MRISDSLETLSGQLIRSQTLSVMLFLACVLPLPGCEQLAGTVTPGASEDRGQSPAPSRERDDVDRGDSVPTAESSDLAAAREQYEMLLARRDDLAAQVAQLESRVDSLREATGGEDLMPVAEFEELLEEREALAARVADLEAGLAGSGSSGGSGSGDTGEPGGPPERGDYLADLQAQVDALENQLSELERQLSSPGAEQQITASGFPIDRLEEARVLAEGLRESVLHLRSTYESGGLGLATAFLIGPDLAVTNAHNVTDGPSSVASQIELTAIDGDVINASVVGYDSPRDVALLRLERPTDLPVLKWGSAQDLSPGDPLLVIGHPGQMGNWIVTAGVFEELSLQVDPSDPSPEVPSDLADAYTVEVYCSVPGMTGNSGSPILNMDGEVVAVLFGSIGIQGAMEEFREPAPDKIYSQAAIVTREMTAGTAAVKARQLIEQFLAGNSG